MDRIDTLLIARLNSISDDPLEEIENSINVIDPRVSKVYFRYKNPLREYTENEFKKRFRFNKNVVMNVILPLILDNLRYETQRALPITPECQLLTALRFYATGSFQAVCADLIHISQSTVSNIVKKVSHALALQMHNFIHFPNTERELKEAKDGFEFLGRRGIYGGLKNFIGALDCTHIKISKPRRIEHTEQYRNRKGYFSLNVQVVGGPHLQIFDIVVRWAGSTHDSRIFRNSMLNVKLQNNDIEGMLVADAGYSCTRHLLTPISNPRTPAEERYNKAQIKTRNSVERLFGLWKRRFPCLQKGLATKLRNTANIIIACAVLHNIAIETKDTIDELETYTVTDEISSTSTINGTSDGMVLRANIIARDFA